MVRMIGFICFWVAVGIVVMMFVSDTVIGVLLTAMLLLLWYQLYFCK